MGTAALGCPPGDARQLLRNFVQQRTTRTAASDPRSRAARSGAALRGRRIQFERGAFDCGQRWCHRLAMGHFSAPVFLAAGSCGHRTGASLSRRGRRLSLGQGSVR